MTGIKIFDQLDHLIVPSWSSWSLDFQGVKGQPVVHFWSCLQTLLHRTYKTVTTPEKSDITVCCCVVSYTHDLRVTSFPAGQTRAECGHHESLSGQTAESGWQDQWVGCQQLHFCISHLLLPLLCLLSSSFPRGVVYSREVRIIAVDLSDGHWLWISFVDVLFLYLLQKSFPSIVLNVSVRAVLVSYYTTFYARTFTWVGHTPAFNILEETAYRITDYTCCCK